jgi:hypothetical protein
MMAHYIIVVSPNNKMVVYDGPGISTNYTSFISVLKGSYPVHL